MRESPENPRVFSQIVEQQGDLRRGGVLRNTTDRLSGRLLRRVAGEAWGYYYRYCNRSYSEPVVHDYKRNQSLTRHTKLIRFERSCIGRARALPGGRREGREAGGRRLGRVLGRGVLGRVFGRRVGLLLGQRLAGRLLGRGASEMRVSYESASPSRVRGRERREPRARTNHVVIVPR